MKNLTSLSRLYLSNNNLEVLPDVICQMSGLTELDVSYNTIYALPDELFMIKHLEKLTANNNRIGVIPFMIGYETFRLLFGRINHVRRIAI